MCTCGHSEKEHASCGKCLVRASPHDVAEAAISGNDLAI
jgi:hypothetical protein